MQYVMRYVMRYVVRYTSRIRDFKGTVPTVLGLELLKRLEKVMTRNYKAESEFGLPSPMPVIDNDGEPKIGAAAKIAVKRGGLPASANDADAIKAGADKDVAEVLREIYSRGEGNLGPGRVGNAELLP